MSSLAWPSDTCLGFVDHKGSCRGYVKPDYSNPRGFPSRFYDQKTDKGLHSTPTPGVHKDGWKYHYNFTPLTNIPPRGGGGVTSQSDGLIVTFGD